MLNELLLKAYQETNYCFAEIVLNIGKISEEAKQILENFSPKGGILITAWNPFGEIKSDEDNQKAKSQLKTDLLAKGLEVISGYGEAWMEAGERIVFLLILLMKNHAKIYVSIINKMLSSILIIRDWLS